MLKIKLLINFTKIHLDKSLGIYFRHISLKKMSTFFLYFNIYDRKTKDVLNTITAQNKVKKKLYFLP